jgi:hypothetical protein
LEEQDDADAAVSRPYPFALLLAVLSMVTGAVYAVLGWEAFP